MTIFNVCLYKLNIFINLLMQCLYNALFINKRALMCWLTNGILKSLQKNEMKYKI